MRNTLSLFCFLVMLGVALPAQAQLRDDVQARKAPAKLYDEGLTGFTLNKLFDPAHFRMSHSFDMSFSSFGGGSSLGMYTNTMQWQFNEKLAARVDLAYAFTPFGGNQFGGGDQQNGRFFLRNAEVAYSPLENLHLNFSVRQSPYGRYASPYGLYGADAGFNRYDELFWRR